MTQSSSMLKLEARRRALQAQLDAGKTQAERNRLGQFATPPALAEDILRYATGLLPVTTKIRFLDPAIGTGAFYAALRAVVRKTRILQALGFEIDPHYGGPAARLWHGTGLDYRQDDFTAAKAAACSNLLVCNPPYVRHHHLPHAEKRRLQHNTRQASGVQPSGLSGLYCYFLGLSHAWMADGGVAGWLIPGEFMDVNYGQTLKRYLLGQVTLLHVHRFEPSAVQFADALVSSAIVWFRKAPPPRRHAVLFTVGGTLTQPRVSRSVAATALEREMKWSRFAASAVGRAVSRKVVVARVADLFDIRRGLATGDNSYFILSLEEIRARKLPLETFRPILPSPRYVPDDQIAADAGGWPILDRQVFLLDTVLPESEIERRYPTLRTYLLEGKQRSVHERYLCRHREPWYTQERRPPAPLLCTYLGRVGLPRRQPFRFILNRSRATAANVYLLMYPTALLGAALDRDPLLIEHVWRALNEITAEDLLAQGRVYGGGLHKLEPRELANVPVPQLTTLLSTCAPPAGQSDLSAQVGG